jgi:hypothetical protein
MLCHFRTVILVLLVSFGAAAAVSADPVTIRFQGVVDATTGTVPPSVGDTLSGSVTFDIPGTDAPPGAASGFFQTRQNVFNLSFQHEAGGPAFDERTLRRQLFTIGTFNDFWGDIGGPFDEVGITLSTFTFPQFNFNISLIDLAGSLFTTNANLPTSLRLEDFELRDFVGSIQVRSGGGQSVVGTFGGRITSLEMGPGPSLVPEPSSLFLVGPLALGLVARARSQWRRIKTGTIR